MTNRLSNLGIFTALALSLSTPAFAADGVKVNELVIAAPIPDAQRDATIHAAARSTTSGTTAMTLC
jgi:hypothetical protein